MGFMRNAVFVQEKAGDPGKTREPLGCPPRPSLFPTADTLGGHN